MGGVGNSPSTTKMAELKQSNGKLGWDWYLLILRVIPEARAILNEGHKDIESVRWDMEILMKAGGIILFVTNEDKS